MKIALATLAIVAAVATPAAAWERQVVTHQSVTTVDASRLRVVSAPVVLPPTQVVAFQPLVRGPCSVERQTIFVNGAPVTVDRDLCRWSDGTLRPMR